MVETSAMWEEGGRLSLMVDDRCSQSYFISTNTYITLPLHTSIGTATGVSGGGGGGMGHPTQAGVAVVNEELAVEGGGCEVIHTAGTICNIPHHYALCPSSSSFSSHYY